VGKLVKMMITNNLYAAISQIPCLEQVSLKVFEGLFAIFCLFLDVKSVSI
jgi:hypothetical protein